MSTIVNARLATAIRTYLSLLHDSPHFTFIHNDLHLFLARWTAVWNAAIVATALYLTVITTAYFHTFAENIGALLVVYVLFTWPILWMLKDNR